MIGPIDLIEFRMTSNTKHLAQLQYGASQYNYCLGTRSNASSYLLNNAYFFRNEKDENEACGMIVRQNS